MREARFYRTKVLPFLKENDFMSIKLSNTGSGHNVGLPDIFVAGHRMAFFIELKASESYETLPSSKKQGVYLGKLMAYGVPALFLCPFLSNTSLLSTCLLYTSPSPRDS